MVEPDGQMALKQVVIDPGGLRNVGQNQGQHRERDQNHAARPGAMHETVVLFVADKKKFRLRLKVTALVIIRCRIDKITPLQNGKMSEPYRKQDTKTSYLPLRNAKLHSL